MLIRWLRRGWEQPGGQVELGQSIEEALKMVIRSTFKERILKSLNEGEHPFFLWYFRGEWDGDGSNIKLL